MTEPLWAPEPKIFSYLAPYRKGLTIPALELGLVGEGLLLGQ